MKRVDDLIESAKGSLSDNQKMSFLAAMIAGFLAHATYLCVQPVCADPVLFMDYVKFGEYQLVNQGRYLFNIGTFLRGYLVITSIAVLFLIFSCALTSVFLVDYFRIKNKFYAVLTGALVASNPCIVHASFLPATSHVVVMQVFFVVSLGFLYRRKKRYITKFLLNTVVLWAALGMGQAFISFYTLLALLLFIKSYLLEKTDRIAIWKNFICSVAACIAGCGLYMGIWKLLRDICKVDVLYGGAGEYSIKNMLVHFPSNFVKAYHIFADYFFKDSVVQNTYWHREYVNFIFLLVAIFLICMVMYEKWKSHILNKIDVAVVVIMTALIPPAALSVIFIVTDYTYYLLMAYPFVLIFPFAFSFLEAVSNRQNKKAICEWIMSGCALFSIWTLLLSENAGYMYMNQTYIQTKEAASRILDRIEQLDGFTYDMPVCFIGQPSGPAFEKDERLLQASPGGVFGETGVWPGIWENSDGWGRYIYQFSGVRLNYFTNGMQDEIVAIARTQQFKSMGVFPAKDSVNMIHGVVVAKLGEVDY